MSLLQATRQGPPPISYAAPKPVKKPVKPSNRKPAVPGGAEPSRRQPAVPGEAEPEPDFHDADEPRPDDAGDGGPAADGGGPDDGPPAGGGGPPAVEPDGGPQPPDAGDDGQAERRRVSDVNATEGCVVLQFALASFLQAVAALGFLHANGFDFKPEDVMSDPETVRNSAVIMLSPERCPLARGVMALDYFSKVSEMCRTHIQATNTEISHLDFDQYSRSHDKSAGELNKTKAALERRILTRQERLVEDENPSQASYDKIYELQCKKLVVEVLLSRIGVAAQPAVASPLPAELTGLSDELVERMRELQGSPLVYKAWLEATRRDAACTGTL